MNIFKYDSPVSQLLIKVADMILLNLLYMLCSLPIFTIGAAQAGLYTAVKVMQDKEDDTSVFAAFFRGFKAGFGTITTCWGVVTLALLFVIWIGISAYILGAPIVPMVISASVILMFQIILPAFHSRFDSNFKMLMRNTFFFILGFPLQCIGVTLLYLLPIGLLAIMDFYSFLGVLPVLALFYFSIAVSASYSLLRKPFDTLISQINSEEEKE